MLKHLSPYPRRRPLLERLGLRRDLSERIILRGVPGDGDLVDEVDVLVAVDDAERTAWTLPTNEVVSP